MQEIRGYDTVTRIANSFNFIKGVVNLYSVIVPLVDMRINSVSALPLTTGCRLAIISIPDLIIGVGTPDGRTLILVDTDNLMSSTEMALITETAY